MKTRCKNFVQNTIKPCRCEYMPCATCTNKELEYILSASEYEELSKPKRILDININLDAFEDY